MVVDYLSSQLDWAGYQVSTKKGSGPSCKLADMVIGITPLKLVREILRLMVGEVQSEGDTGVLMARALRYRMVWALNHNFPDVVKLLACVSVIQL